jgi:hypothetical protein
MRADAEAPGSQGALGAAKRGRKESDAGFTSAPRMPAAYVFVRKRRARRQPAKDARASRSGST